MKYDEAIALFAAALQVGDDEQLPVTDATRANLGYYRGNVIANRSSALASAFPSVHDLVGETYFVALTEAYIRATPSISGNLHDDGTALPGFISSFAPAAELPYLPDVARLDWAIHSAHFAADILPADLTPLQTLDPAGFGQIRVDFHPAVSLVVSADWPIHAIYAMHHGAAPANLSAGGESVLVWRDDLLLVDVATQSFLQALLTGSSIDQACERAWQNHADFDPSPALAQLFGCGLVTALHHPS